MGPYSGKYLWVNQTFGFYSYYVNDPLYTVGLNYYLVFRLGNKTLNNKCIKYTSGFESTKCLTKKPSNGIPLVFDDNNIY